MKLLIWFFRFTILLLLPINLKAQTVSKERIIDFSNWEINNYPIGNKNQLSPVIVEFDTLFVSKYSTFCSVYSYFEKSDIEYFHEQIFEFSKNKFLLRRNDIQKVKIKKKKKSNNQRWYYSQPIFTKNNDFVVIWKGYYENPEASEDKLLIYKLTEKGWVLWKIVCQMIS